MNKLAKLIWLPLLVLSFSPTLNAKTYKPILKVKSNINVPLMGFALRDPMMVKKRISDEIEAEQVIYEITEYKADLKRAHGDRRVEILTVLVENYVRLSYYLRDVESGRLDADGSSKLLKKNIVSTNNMVVRYAKSLAKGTKNKKKKAWAMFHVLMTRYMVGGGKSTIVKNLNGIKKNLNAYLKRRSSLLIGYRTIVSRGKGIKKAVKTLQGLVSKLNKDGAMFARAVLARYHAGLDGRGKKVFKKNTKLYRKYLAQATKRARYLSASQKEKLLKFSIAVVMKSEKKVDWNKLPINLTPFVGSKVTRAIIERSAIQDWKAGHSRKALKKYAILAKETEGTMIDCVFRCRISVNLCGLSAKD